MKRRPEVVCESEKERIERLAIKDYDDMEERREAKINDKYAKYTFEPEINNVSKAMAMDIKFR